MAEQQDNGGEGPKAKIQGTGEVTYPPGFIFPPGHPDEGYVIPEEGPYTAPSSRGKQR